MPRYFCRLGFMQRRKPVLSHLNDGGKLLRLCGKQAVSWMYQLPPQLSRRVPEEEPLGSVIPLDKLPCQSRHHSHTFPCMS